MGEIDILVDHLLFNVVSTVRCGNKKQEAVSLSLKLPAYIRALFVFFMLSPQNILIPIIDNLSCLSEGKCYKVK